MRLTRPVLKLTALGAALLLAAGCTATLDKSSVKAKAGATESTETEVVSIPYDPAYPKYVVAVEPFVFSRTFAPNEHGMTINIRQGGEELAAKLTTALANSGNISVVDSGLRKSNSGTYSARLNKGEVGPFVIRATVTEFTENAEAESEKVGGSLGWAGAATGIAGAITGNDALTWTGAGVAAANPTLEQETASRTGMVAIDFRVVDGRTGRVTGAFKAAGNFTAASATSGFSLFGIGKQSHKFAQSALGQAVQMAVNDAVTKITSELKSKVRK